MIIKEKNIVENCKRCRKILIQQLSQNNKSKLSLFSSKIEKGEIRARKKNKETKV